MVAQSFFAGIFGGLALSLLAFPILARLPLASGGALTPARRTIAAVLAAAIAAGLAVTGPSPAPARIALPAAGTSAFAEAAKVMDQASTPPPPAAPSTAPAGAGTSASAGSMDSAIASLEARLAKGGGSADDWELLAKSFEFLGRPSDAAEARAHRLPAAGTPGKAAPAGAGVAVSGEVTLDPALASRVKTGETIFIIAKSVDSPGPPLAVYRGTVGEWPLRFRLDDSQSMLPGRTLSGAHRVTIEARISAQGQPLAASGDLQGASGVIDPAASKPLSIHIDKSLP
jgi:hypothetical protein